VLVGSQFRALEPGLGRPKEERKGEHQIPGRKADPAMK
jgi:hypothetical protein